MSKRPFELSVWKDTYVDNIPQEEFVAVIGSDIMDTPFSVVDPKLTRQINGQKKLEFSIYTKIKDNSNGEWIENPFKQFIQNETKLKLRDGRADGDKCKWYDFIIKTIKEDDSKHTITVTADDQWVQELSKNGFNIQFDTQLKNNQGTVIELAKAALKDTDWQVGEQASEENPNGTHFIANIAEEPLVKLCVTSNQSNVHRILDTNYQKYGYVIDDTDISSLQVNDIIYAFYSCCDKTCKRFQFIKPNLVDASGEAIFSVNDRLILDTDCQYFIDLTEPLIENTDFNIYLPSWVVPSGEQIPGKPDDTTKTTSIISLKYRANKYTYANVSEYYPLVKAYGINYRKSNARSNTDDLIYFKDKKYQVTSLIDDFITNGRKFTNTSGWSGMLPKNIKKSLPTVAYTAKDQNGAGRWATDSWETRGETTQDFEPIISCTNLLKEGFITNSGPYDSRTKIGTFVQGRNYIFELTYKSNCSFKVYVGQYVLEKGRIKVGSLHPITTELTFDPSDEDKTITLQKLQIKWPGDGQTSTQFKHTQTRVFFDFSESTILYNDDVNITYLDIYNCRFYEDLGLEKGQQITPETQVIDSPIIYTHKWYHREDLITAEDIEDIKPVVEIVSKNDPSIPEEAFDLPELQGYSIVNSLEKIRHIDIKDSNYFNILQKIAETFGCWLDIYVTRDPETRQLETRYVRYQNYIGQEQLAGFKYGVNLTSINRDINSTALVTKLIVKDNHNQFGEDKFCSITRAKANETGGNIIYNFDYYINQNMLDATVWYQSIYGYKDTTDVAHYGYYPRWKANNDSYNEAYEKYKQSVSLPLIKNESALKLAEEELTAAEMGLEDALAEFEGRLGFPYSEDNDYLGKYLAVNINEGASSTEAPLTVNVLSDGSIVAAQIVEEDRWSIVSASSNRKYSEKIWEYERRIINARAEFENQQTQHEELLAAKATHQTSVKELNEDRDAINQEFYEQFYPFIQEGTWIDDSYLDDDLYYNDGLSTLYNSCYPKVTYAINVADLSVLPGYEDYTVNLGDQTFVEDVEMFGYDNLGGPKHEAVTVTELVINFNDPTKNSIKVQTYRNQFQDLFQQVTATVQSVQYQEGGYKRAAALEAASAYEKSAFLQDALSDAGLLLQSGNSVQSDNSGVTSINAYNKNKLLRIANGVLAFSKDGGQTWNAALTSDGINASLINTGLLNANEICIMNGNDPTFRWDQYGLTAFDFTTSGAVKEVNFTRGVRFDKNGIYGFVNQDGRTWVPTSFEDIDKNSKFYITWEGLKISHFYHQIAPTIDKEFVLKLGKIDDKVYRGWSSTKIPVEVPSSSDTNVGYTFIPLVQIGEINNYSLTIYSDGTITCRQLFVTDGVGFTSAASPYKTVYHTSTAGLVQPANNTMYNQFSDHDPSSIEHVWHKIQDENDAFYSTTDNGGATWSDPLPLMLVDNYTIEITSSNGTSFFDGNVDTYLNAHVYYDTTDITNLIGSGYYSNYSIKWYLDDTYLSTGAQYHVTSIASIGAVVYTCKLETGI